MEKINITELSGFLNENVHVSIPLLMKQYDLRYDEAKELMNCIIERGWVSEKPNGVEYEVFKEYLFLRKFKRHEIKEVCKDIDNDCAAVIDYLMKNYWATYFDLVRVVHGDDDTKAAIKYLKEKNIIYENRRKYFLNIDKKTSETLINYVGEKLRRTRHHRNSEMSIEEEMEKMFNEIFGDEETDGTNQ